MLYQPTRENRPGISLFLLCILFAVACSNKKSCYLNNPAISDASGNPKDSLTFYFPKTLVKDTTTIKPNLDSFRENWYSSSLYRFKEPVLCNYYLGRDEYRFLWLRSFHRPMVFTLTKSGDNIEFTVKKLDRQPQFYSERIIGGGEDEAGGRTYEKHNDTIVILADRKAGIVYNKTQRLSPAEWNKFGQLLQKANFWGTSVLHQNDTGMDGAEWIFEAHLKKRYWFVDKWSPEDAFKDAGVYLIKLSGLKEEIY